MNHHFVFDAYRLNPAARELWQGDHLIPLPRRVFDGLCFMIEHRERAVTYDEITRALWGHTGISNVQVSQLVMQMRRAVGDDSRRQAVIRTVPGFGYRWAAAVEPVSTAEPQLSAHTAGQAIAVLPLTVTAATEDTAWIRLGAMDLIAGHLRQAGLTVPSSDDVVAAVHVSNTLPESERHAALRRTLNAETLVRGAVSRGSDAWQIELIASDASDEKRQVSHQGADVLKVARQATQLLLSALGRATPENGGNPSDVPEYLQRIRAALLADEIDTARLLCERAPSGIKDDPRLQYELANIEFRFGRLDAAGELVTALLGRSEVTGQPNLHARALGLRGQIAIRTVGLADWQQAEADFDRAVRVLDNQAWSTELGRALARRGLARGFLGRFSEALRDLGSSRTQFEVTGNRQDMIHIHSYFGLIELKRSRPHTALAHFSDAAEISRSFGAADRLRAGLSGMMEAQIRLLRWSEALKISEQMLALLDKTGDPAHRAHVEIGHTNLLIQLGRLHEAEVLLARLGSLTQRFPPPFISFGHRAQATLHWLQGRFDAAMNSAAEVLALWPADVSMDADQRARMALLHQRAAIAAGKPRPAWSPFEDAACPSPEDDVIAIYRLAHAEWEAFRGRHDKARELFDEAVVRAETFGLPDTLVLVADSSARWLLTRGKITEASALAGRVAQWAAHDYDCALLQTTVLHAAGQTEAWARALRQTRALAGERRISEELLTPPH